MSKLLKKITPYFSTYNIRTPFDLKLFKSQDTLNIVKKSLQARYRDISIADNVAKMLEMHKKSLYELEQVNKAVNVLQGEIKMYMRSSGGGKEGKDGKVSKDKGNDKQKDIDKVNDTKLNTNNPSSTSLSTSTSTSSLTPQQHQTNLLKISTLKQSQIKMQSQIKQLTKKLQQQIIKIGNIVDHKTPISKDQSQNQILKTYTPQNGLINHNISYSQICQKFNLTDLKRGQKVGGHRGYFLRNNAVKLSLALADYGMKFLQKHGYELYQSPAIIAESILKGSCQLQSIQEDVYKLQGMDSYLIATSEQSLAGYYKGQVLANSKLPIRMAGYSTCFRKQAGAHGKDIHGLFRLHQFQKVQQFTIVHPQNSQAQMKRMMDISQLFYQSLGLPYRVVNIVSGELNDAAACKYDLQAWYPSQRRYRELVSVSNCTEYQSRLLKVLYQSVGNQQKYPHMLNGTLVAIQRTMTCIIENYYDGKDGIGVPKVLQEYLGTDRIVLEKEKEKEGKEWKEGKQGKQKPTHKQPNKK